MQNRGKKLLVVHHGALGDFITTFPALHQAACQYPSIDAVCQNKLGRLAGYLGLIGTHFPLESAVVGSLFAETIAPRLKRIIAPYPAVILFSFSETLEDALRRLTGQRIHRVDPRPKPEEKIRVALHHLSGLRSAGFFPDSVDPEQSLRRSLARRRRGADFDAFRVILHPGSGSVRKNWPLSGYIRLAAMLTAKGFQTTFLCGPAEAEMVPEIEAAGHAVHAGDDLVATCRQLQMAGGFIGNDSGVGHLAAYLGVPTVAIFGPSDPARWRPAGLSVSVVRADTGCPPCFENTRDRCPSPKCLLEITPSQVADAFFDLTGRSAPIPGSRRFPSG